MLHTKVSIILSNRFEATKQANLIYVTITNSASMASSNLTIPTNFVGLHIQNVEWLQGIAKLLRNRENSIEPLDCTLSITHTHINVNNIVVVVAVVRPVFALLSFCQCAQGTFLLIACF